MLEKTAYFQGSRSVDDYLDDFHNLILESGYTSPKTIVVKFRRGLDLKIGDAVATMAANQSNDLDPEAWYEAAVRIDQNRATNEVFRNSVKTPDSHQPLPREPKIAEDLSEVSEDETRSLDIVPLLKVGSEVLDIKNMSADDIHNLLQQLSTVQQMDKPSAPPPPKKMHFPPLHKSRTHLLNQYQALVVEEAPNSEVHTSEIPEATCA